MHSDKGMSKLFWPLILAALAAVSIGACTESNFPVATGKGNLRGINAIVTAPDVVFLVEERPLGGLFYKDGLATRFDDLPYNVNFDVLFPGGTLRTRIATEAVQVIANTEHVFALTGSLAAPDVLRVEYPERQWTGDETVFEARVLHLAATAAELDVYFAAPGTVPVLGDQRATLTMGEVSAAFEAPAGDYQLVLTTRDNATDILYRSRTITQVGATSLLFSIFDPDPSITGSLSVRVMGPSGGSAEVADQNSLPTIRLMHTSIATGNVDLYANDDFTTSLFSDVAFGELTGETDFGTAAVPLTYTPTGNTGVLLLEDDLTVPAGSRNTVFLIGAAGELDSISFQDDHRPIQTTGRLRFVQLADNGTALDIYVLPSGEEVADNFPSFFSMPFRATSGYVNFFAGSYQVAITLPGVKNIIGGPLTLDLALGDVVELAVLDTTDPNLFNVVIYDN